MANTVFVPGAQSGYMIPEIVPEARGKAEALRTFLARGGQRRSQGKGNRGGSRYVSGPFKGKTQDEVMVEFEKRWAGASPEIKDKYAGMAGVGALSPSEKKDYDARVAERKGMIGGIAPAPEAKTKPTPEKKTLVDTEKGFVGPGEPIEQRMKQVEADREAKRTYTPSPGYGADGKPIAAMSKQSTIAFNDNMLKGGLSPVGDGSAIIPPTRNNDRAALIPPKKSSDSDNAVMARAKANSAPIIEAAKQKVTELEGENVIRAKQGLPPIPVPAATDPAIMGEAKKTVSPPPQPATPPQASTPTPTPAPVPAIAGATKPMRINPAFEQSGLGKLPFGYTTGDKVDPQFQKAADESVARQKAVVATPWKPPTNLTPVGETKPTITGSTPAPHISAFTGKAVDPNMSMEERQANYRESQKKYVTGEEYEMAKEIDRLNPNQPKIATPAMGWGVARDGSQLTIDSPEMATIKKMRIRNNPALAKADAIEQQRLAFNKRNPKIALDADPRKNKPLIAFPRA